MSRVTGINENIPTNHLLQEYDELISCKSLGSYNCCEMLSVFLWNKKKKVTVNVYTIFVFENRISVNKKSERLFSELQRITDEYSLGIQKKLLDISAVRSVFEMLCQNREHRKIDIGDGALTTGHLEGVSKVFVQQNSTKEIVLNRVLKNNFKNGSYILEFFDVDKTIFKEWKARDMRKLTDKIYAAVPIDLFSVSDRLGNFVFQFPSLNVNSKYEVNETESELTYHVSFREGCGNDDEFMLISEGILDELPVAFGSVRFQRDGCDMVFSVGDASRFCKSTIIDIKRQLILSRQETSFMRQISSVMEINSQYGEERVIYDDKGEIVTHFAPASAQRISVGPPVFRRRDGYMEKRQYNRRVDDLYKRALFRQYGRKKEQGRAFKDVIALMNRSQTGKVYLWDPYLTVEDILNTWYYTKSMGTTLLAITSGEIAEKTNTGVKNWIREQREIMEKRSNHYGIHAELRCQWGGFGYSFHDRFLMIIENDGEKPIVWSLGTSINSLGKKHHVIQSVEHPQILVDTFEELWEELRDTECLVWKAGYNEE